MIFKKTKVLVLRTAGTNCDKETAYAFSLAGAKPELVHINSLVSGEKFLKDFSILAIPGGFSYGDDVASGKILANEIRHKLRVQIDRFIGDGKLAIGICNGFQILVKMGLLPNISNKLDIEATLTLNDSAKFEARWVYLKNAKIKDLPPYSLNRSGIPPKDKNEGGKESKCIWTRDIEDVIYLPVAHGEGKFIPRDDKVLTDLKNNGQIVLQYCSENGQEPRYPEDPNGSIEDIAGICDPTGRIFGLMPHPERHVRNTQHPRWTRLPAKKGPDGLKIIKSAVVYAKKHL